MDAYDAAAQAAARQLTLSYSTSFGSATKLFPVSIRADIFNIYGMVRVADEIVDTYCGADKRAQLDAYETAVYAAIENRYSTDLILHAFQLAAVRYDIPKALIAPFFASMRTDINPPENMTQKQYEEYIYGSAEVVGLMCLKVFCGADRALYRHLEPGARALGAGFQKLNFLRDFAADTKVLKRHYFPGVGDNLTEVDKQAIIADIRRDFAAAEPALGQLPANARPAVTLAYRYYLELLNKLSNSSADQIMKQRIRIPNARKALLMTPSLLKAKVRK